MRLQLLGRTFLLCLVLAVTSAQASLIVSPVDTDLTAYGFGTAHSILTLQNSPLERGCVFPANNTGGFTTLCSVFQNGYTDLAGSISTVDVAQKYGTPTLASLGVTSWATLGLLLNANEPGAGGQYLTLQRLTLAVYGGINGNTLQGTFNLAAPVDLFDTAQGQGSSGFVITIGQDQWQSVVFNSAFRIGLAAEIGCKLAPCSVAGQWPTGDGAESFSIVELAGGGPGQEVPEPATAALLGGGLIVFAWALRRRNGY